MKKMHSLLRRQLRRLFSDERQAPAEWVNLLEQVDEAYRQFDRDRKLLERSMEISSRELAQANTDIRAVLDGLVDYYLRLDHQGRILYARGHAFPAFFRPVATPAGHMLHELLQPDELPVWVSALADMKDQPHTHVFEVSSGNENGQRVYEARFIPAHHDQVSVILRDVTEAKQLQERERELQKRLAQAERIESVGILAGGVAHDLNNILSPLVSYPDLILAELPAGNPSRNIVKQMQRAAMRAAAIIQDLMTLARRGTHQVEDLDVNELIRNYLDSPDFKALGKRFPDVQLITELGDRLAMIRGASHQFVQVIMNLIANAYEAVKSAGQVTIRTSMGNMRPAHQRYSLTSETVTAIQIEIRDTGCGIPADEIDHIFEPFFSRRKKGKSGTGLGLAIVYGVVQDIGGAIEVTSPPGQGTRFIMHLPALELPSDPIRSSTSAANTPISKVLVVDDEPMQRELARLLLSTKGCDVQAVASGRLALDYLRANSADIVLLDMIMEPDFDGLATYEAIHAMKPDQRVLIVSGFAESENVSKALDLGVRGFIQKPFTLDILYQAMQRAMGPIIQR